MDKVLTYASDIVNKIRVGRHPDNTVRVVLDLEDVSSYSVFTLYSPFRLVIDAERTRGATPPPWRSPPLPSRAAGAPLPHRRRRTRAAVCGAAAGAGCAAGAHGRAAPAAAASAVTPPPPSRAAAVAG